MKNKLTLQVIEAYSIPFRSALQRNGGIQLKNAIKEKKEKEIKEKKIKEFILAHYVFERRNASPYFKWQAIELLNDSNYWINGKAQEDKMWREFHNSANEKSYEELKKQYEENKEKNNKGKQYCLCCESKVCIKNVNAKNNPLFTSKNANKKSIWQVDFAEHIQNLNSEDGIVKLYKELIAIHGIGPKIASYILRDLVMYSDCKYGKGSTIKNKELTESEKVVYYYLQPIDTWLRLIADELFLYEKFPDLKEELKGLKRELMKNLENADAKYKNLMKNVRDNIDVKNLSGLKIGNSPDGVKIEKFRIKSICDECIEVGVNPLKFNQGAWYVGARVMRCRPQFEQILEKEDEDRAWELIKSGIIDDELDPYSPRDIAKNENRKKFMHAVLDKKELKQKFSEKIAEVIQKA